MSFHLDDLDSMANSALALTQVKDPWTNTQSETSSSKGPVENFSNEYYLLTLVRGSLPQTLFQNSI